MSDYLHLHVESKERLDLGKYFPKEVLHSVRRTKWTGHKIYSCFLDTIGDEFNIRRNINDYLTLCFCITDLLTNSNVIRVSNNRGHVFTIEGVWDLFLEKVRNRSK